MVNEEHDTYKLLSQAQMQLRKTVACSTNPIPAVEIVICYHLNTSEGFDLMKDTRQSELCKGWGPPFT